MSVALQDPDALGRIAGKLIERSPIYSAREAVEIAVAECGRRGMPVTGAAVSRARAAAKQAVEARIAAGEADDQRERAENRSVLAAADELLGRLEAPQAAPAEVAGVEHRRALLGMPSGLLASIRFDPDAEDRPPTWRVKGMLPETGLGLLYGESQAGKSFLAVWIALSVAYGLPFFGRRTKPGGVLYIAAEGGKSVVRRFRVANAKLRDALPAANMARKGQPPLSRAPIEIVHEAPNLSREGKPGALRDTILKADQCYRAEGSRLVLVVLDTYHASLGGADENSAADAGHALRPLKEAVEATGAFVLVVHHPGKDTDKGARGSNALVAAVDTSIELRVPTCAGAKAKPSTALRHATIIKQRDGEAGPEFYFKLPVVEIGCDEDGDPVTTCVVEPADSPRVDADGLTERDRAFLDCIRGAIQEGGRDRGRLDVARKAYINRLIGDNVKAQAAKGDWYRRLKILRDADRIACDEHDEWVWIPAAPAEDAD